VGETEETRGFVDAKKAELAAAVEVNGYPRRAREARLTNCSNG
jgi:hypothetical protein